MSDSDKNIFKIMDGIIGQINKTKKLFIIMILTIMVLPPLTFLITSAIFDPPFEHMEGHRGPFTFFHFRSIPFLISLGWLAIGIRQWFVLSKWDKKYKKYKEMQRKIDEKLDKDDEKD